MKIVRFTLCFLVSLFLSASVAYAQSVKSAVEVFRKNSAALVDPLSKEMKTSSSVSDSAGALFNEPKARRKPPAIVTDSPGTTPLFVLHSTHQYARPGDVVSYNLVALQNITEKVCVYGQVLKPGPNMGYDGTYPVGYFQMESGYGGCISGVAVAQFVKAHTRMINPEDPRGTMVINMVITDEQGTLLQQIITDLYIVQSDQYGPMHYVQTAKKNGANYLLSGRFPIGIPIYFVTGVPGLGYSLSGTQPDSGLISTDGRKLVIPEVGTFSTSTSLDFMGWDPVSRQAIIAPNFRTAIQ